MKVFYLVKRSVTLFLATIFSWRKVNAILIVSTGRTGTEFIANLFAQLYGNDLVSLHEPAPDLLKISVESRLHGWPVSKVVREIKLARFPYLAKSNGTECRCFIESNNNLAFLLPVLRKVFPNIRILFFTRNLESFLVSEMNKRHGSNGFLIFGDQDKRSRITPMVLKGPYQAKWLTWSRQEKIIWYWWVCNRYILEHIGDYSYMHIRFEDFFRDKASARCLMAKMIRFVGLPENINYSKIDDLLDKKINSSKHAEFTSVAELSADAHAFFEKVNLELNSKLGY